MNFRGYDVMNNFTAVLVSVVLAALFGLAAVAAFAVLGFRDTTWWLPLAIVTLAGAGLILHMWALRREAATHPDDVGKETVMATVHDRVATGVHRKAGLPWLTILFVAVAFIATVAVSFPQELARILASI
jgi:hypothetical protein